MCVYLSVRVSNSAPVQAGAKSEFTPTTTTTAATTTKTDPVAKKAPVKRKTPTVPAAVPSKQVKKEAADGAGAVKQPSVRRKNLAAVAAAAESVEHAEQDRGSGAALRDAEYGALEAAAAKRAELERAAEEQKRGRPSEREEGEVRISPVHLIIRWYRVSHRDCDLTVFTVLQVCADDYGTNTSYEELARAAREFANKPRVEVPPLPLGSTPYDPPRQPPCEQTPPSPSPRPPHGRELLRRATPHYGSHLKDGHWETATHHTASCVGTRTRRTEGREREAPRKEGRARFTPPSLTPELPLSH